MVLLIQNPRFDYLLGRNEVPRVGADDTKIPRENRVFHDGDGANNGAVDESRAKLEVIISQINTLTPSQIEAILRIVRERL